MICAVATSSAMALLRTIPASRLDRSALVHSSSGRGPHRYHLAPSPIRFRSRSPAGQFFRSSRITWFWLPCFLRRFAHGSMETSNRSNAHDVAIGLAPLVHLPVGPYAISPQQEIAGKRRSGRQRLRTRKSAACWTTPAPNRGNNPISEWKPASRLHIQEEVFRLIRSVSASVSRGIGLHRTLERLKNHLESVAHGHCTANGIFAPSNVGAATERSCASEDTRNRGALTCLEKVLRWLPLIVNAKPSARCPSRTTVLCILVPTRVRLERLGSPTPPRAAVADISRCGGEPQPRESLRLQAFATPHRPLHRRYMQEFLERELHSARRKRRPLPS